MQVYFCSGCWQLCVAAGWSGGLQHQIEVQAVLRHLLAALGGIYLLIA